MVHEDGAMPGPRRVGSNASLIQLVIGNCDV